LLGKKETEDKFKKYESKIARKTVEISEAKDQSNALHHKCESMRQKLIEITEQFNNLQESQNQQIEKTTTKKKKS